MDNFYDSFSFQKLFVRIEKSENSTMAHVTNNGYLVDSFLVFSKNEKDFGEECERYLASNRYKQNLEKQRGY
jgi:hypothetical protein